MIEIMTFRLLPGADEADFLAADRLVQIEFAYQQPGLLRRTTARAEHGDWIVIDLWRSAEDASAADARFGQDPVTASFLSFVDHASIATARYDTVD